MSRLPRMAERDLQPELMDQPELAADEHHRALNGLARCNILSNSAGSMWPAIQSLARQQGKRPLRILDLATGGGDVILRLWRKAKRARLRLSIQGYDISPRAIEHAQHKSSEASGDLCFKQADVLRDKLPEGFDVVMSSLFLHHLTRVEAVQLLRKMAAASKTMVLINDLERCLSGYLLVRAATPLITRSTVVHSDGLRSVAGAFSLEESQQLAIDAGLATAQIRRCWPFRFVLTWKKPSRDSVCQENATRREREALV